MVYTDVLARAVGHPLRVRIIAALDDGPCGVDALMARVESDRRTVVRHARVLEQAGLVCSTRSPRGTTYQLATQVSFSDEDYASLRDTGREAAVAAALAHAHTAAASALEAGGFERPDVHVSRTSLAVTEAQWQYLSARFADLLDEVDDVKAEVAEPGAQSISATAVMMLFERPESAREHRPTPEDEPFSMGEGLERSWDLAEDLERTLAAAATDWPAVIALADQLRVLARAALAAELRDSATLRDSASPAHQH